MELLADCAIYLDPFLEEICRTLVKSVERAEKKPELLKYLVPRMEALATKAEKSNSLEHVLAAKLLHSLSTKAKWPEYYPAFLTKYLEAHAKKPNESQSILAIILQLKQLEEAEAKKKQEAAKGQSSWLSISFPITNVCWVSAL